MSMLNIGYSGLNAAQMALNVASNNIANANTAGYSRQEVLMGSRLGNGSLDNGNGVQVSSVRRIADNYLIAQLWRSGSASGFQSSFNQYINTTEQVLGSSALNISTGVDNFFAALSAASESPESSAPRQQIVSAATALAGRYNQLAVNLDNQERQLADQLTTSVEQLNSTTTQVAKLNQQITELSARGGNVSQLEDQRDQSLRDLAKLVDIQVNRMDDGTVSVSLSQGQPLVLANSSASLVLKGDDLSLQFGTQSFPIEQKLQGSLGGLLGYRQDVLRPTRNELNSMATLLADELNKQQAQGFDINSPAGQGKPLFTYDTADPARTLGVATGFGANDLAFTASKLDAVTGTLVADGGSGDNRNLQAMLALKDHHYDAYAGLLGSLAVQSSQSAAELTANKQLEAQVKSQVDSVSGVNQDEEGVSIMQYTKAYQANAKVISTANELFDSLLSMF